jgi:hypothetical protein
VMDKTNAPAGRVVTSSRRFIPPHLSNLGGHGTLPM